MYKDSLKGSYDISAVVDFLTKGIQALQHQGKKCVKHKGDNVENLFRQSLY